MITIGGLLAGIGFATGLALVIHAIAQANPAAFPNGVGDQVVLILLVIGPLFGLGLGLMTGGLIPDDPAPQAEPRNQDSGT
jgi:hypothetical protein